MDELKSAAGELLGWTIGHALPLWAGAGFDRRCGRFEERLSMKGEPVTDVPVRLMVQARQIFTYGLAARRRWHGGALELVETAYASMVRDYYRRDGHDGWIYSIWRDGTVADTRRDLYAHAFVLLAIGSYVHATGRREALTMADETLRYIDEHMRAPLGGGFVDAVPPVDGVRRQNPHMHVFEGALKLWSASSEPRFLVRAGEIFGLFNSRFFRPGLGVLSEYFDAGLELAGGTDEIVVEPGHHYEWVWLLRWFERESGIAVKASAEALFDYAWRHGHDAAGLVADELLADGTPRKRSRRVWPMTEAIKANIAEGALGRPGALAMAATLAKLLGDYFLTQDPKGGWVDRLDERGKCATDFMPASTLYHIVSAVDELQRFAFKTSAQR